jgi:tetratricopeptide (TPR) repeat protein
LKKAILILAIILLSLLYYAGVLNRQDTLPLSKEFFATETSSLGGWTWDIAKPSPHSTKDIEPVYQLKLDRGIQNLPVLSFLLIREAEEARKAGDLQRALEMADYSIRFSPDLPQPYFELARVRFSQNPFKVYVVLSDISHGMMNQIHYYPASLVFFYNLFFILSNAVLLAFTVFGIVVIIKYLPLYFFDIRKTLTQELPKLLINSLKVLFLLIPFFLRLDMLWAIFYWSALLWGYVTKREKQFIVIFLILLVYLPFFIKSSSSFLNSRSSDILLQMNQANHEEGDRGTQEKMKGWVSTHPDDADVLFTLGLVEKKHGNLAEAEAYYRKAIRANPKFASAYSNLGNVLLAQKQVEPAIDMYQQAIQFAGDHGAYYYNLYRAYSQETFLSEKSGKVFQRAMQLSPKLVEYYSSLDNPNRPPNINRLVIDEVLPSQRFWNRLYLQFIGQEGILFRLFEAWFEIVPSRIPLLVPLVFLGYLIGMGRFTRPKRFMTRCPLCGVPTLRFYLGNSEDEYICFNCYRIFIQKEKLHPKIMENKKNEVRHFQKKNHFITRFVSFFFVGLGYLWRGHIFRGLLSLFFFFIFILRFVYWNGVITTSLSEPALNIWAAALWGGLLVLFYLFSVRWTLRTKPRFEFEK